MNRAEKINSRNSRREEQDDNEESDNIKSNRGRKLTEPNKYYFESEQKIKAWRDKLKYDKTLTSADKQKLRNQISA